MPASDLEIAPATVGQIIVMAREGATMQRQLHQVIADLNDDEKASLTAIAWVGRGAFEPEDFAEALATARASRVFSAADRPRRVEPVTVSRWRITRATSNSPVIPPWKAMKTSRPPVFNAAILVAR